MLETLESVSWNHGEPIGKRLKVQWALHRLPTMSAAEILEELSKLTHEERLSIYRHIARMERLDEIEPSAELNGAIEQGLRSLETEPVVPLEEVRDKIAQWAGLSS